MHGYSVYATFSRGPSRHRRRAVLRAAHAIVHRQAAALQRIWESRVPAGRARLREVCLSRRRRDEHVRAESSRAAACDRHDRRNVVVLVGLRSRALRRAAVRHGAPRTALWHDPRRRQRTAGCAHACALRAAATPRAARSRRRSPRNPTSTPSFPEASMRSIVVTGASSGIGAALARRAAATGWRVLAVARRADRLEALAREIQCDDAGRRRARPAKRRRRSSSARCAHLGGSTCS